MKLSIPILTNHLLLPHSTPMASQRLKTKQNIYIVSHFSSMCSQWLFPELGEWPLQTQSTKKALEESDP
jgi:hypothetical protein